MLHRIHSRNALTFRSVLYRAISEETTEYMSQAKTANSDDLSNLEAQLSLLKVRQRNSGSSHRAHFVMISRSCIESLARQHRTRRSALKD